MRTRKSRNKKHGKILIFKSILAIYGARKLISNTVWRWNILSWLETQYPPILCDIENKIHIYSILYGPLQSQFEVREAFGESIWLLPTCLPINCLVCDLRCDLDAYKQRVRHMRKWKETRNNHVSAPTNRFVLRLFSLRAIHTRQLKIFMCNVGYFEVKWK